MEFGETQLFPKDAQERFYEINDDAVNLGDPVQSVEDAIFSKMSKKPNPIAPTPHSEPTPTNKQTNR